MKRIFCILTATMLMFSFLVTMTGCENRVEQDIILSDNTLHVDLPETYTLSEGNPTYISKGDQQVAIMRYGNSNSYSAMETMLNHGSSDSGLALLDSGTFDDFVYLYYSETLNNAPTVYNYMILLNNSDTSVLISGPSETELTNIFNNIGMFINNDTSESTVIEMTEST